MLISSLFVYFKLVDAVVLCSLWLKQIRWLESRLTDIVQQDPEIMTDGLAVESLFPFLRQTVIGTGTVCYLLGRMWIWGK